MYVLYSFAICTTAARKQPVFFSRALLTGLRSTPWSDDEQTNVTRIITILTILGTSQTLQLYGTPPIVRGKQKPVYKYKSQSTSTTTCTPLNSIGLVTHSLQKMKKLVLHNLGVVHAYSSARQIYSLLTCQGPNNFSAVPARTAR